MSRLGDYRYVQRVGWLEPYTWFRVFSGLQGDNRYMVASNGHTDELIRCINYNSVEDAFFPKETQVIALGKGTAADPKSLGSFRIWS